ncbi:MAG: caspase family protein [Pseudomonadota bacterium]
MTKKALLVGINDYAPVGAGGPDLRGCVNDVRDVANTLSVLGIVPAAPGTMQILTDARATRAAILNGFKWLIKGAKKGDVLVFHYSGHGSQVADVSGDELDRKDETICPHDYATAGMIKDDDFRALLAGLPEGVNLDIILDSCHSGTGTRELAALAVAPEEQAVAYRYIEPPIDWGFFLDANPSLPVRGILMPGGTGGARDAVVVSGLNHVLWAGCRDNQTSAETLIGGVYRGVFTYHFCKVLRGAGVSITRRRLDAQVTVNVRGYGQVPQLEGTSASLSERVFT